MAAIAGKAIVAMTVSIDLTEPEARALDAMVGYGDDAFINAFYEHLGKAYMKDHEIGLRTFLKSVRDFMPNVIRKADAARKAFRNPDLIQS